MSNVTQYIRPTTIVRQVMYKAGGRKSWSVYTNTYKTCRTVKCYAAGPTTDLNMITEIISVLTTLGVDFSVRRGLRSVIIRLPK